MVLTQTPWKKCSRCGRAQHALLTVSATATKETASFVPEMALLLANSHKNVQKLTGQFQITIHRHIIQRSRHKPQTSPTYFCTSSEPMTRMKQASVLLATARAHNVLPVPGGPNSNTPFGGSMPRFTNLSGCTHSRIKYQLNHGYLAQMCCMMHLKYVVILKKIGINAKFENIACSEMHG